MNTTNQNSNFCEGESDIQIDEFEDIYERSEEPETDCTGQCFSDADSGL